MFLLINDTGKNIKPGKVGAFAVGHFTVTGGNEARVDLVLIQPFLLSYANDAVLKPTNGFSSIMSIKNLRDWFVSKQGQP